MNSLDMKRLSKLCLAFLLTLAFTHTGFGQIKTGTTAAQFLKIGIGARASAMGEAFVAVANDATAIYWNPAGTARIGENQVYFGYSDWFLDLVYNNAFGSFNVPRVGTVGVQVTSLTMDEMKVRTEEQQEGTGEFFDASDLSMGLNFARNLTDRFSIGFNFKYIQQQIWHMKASSFAIDVGTLFTTQFNGMRLGMSISNFGSKLQMRGRDTLIKHDPDPFIDGNNDQINAHYDVDRWSLPLIFRVGLAMDLIESKFLTTTVAVDAIHPNDNYEYVNTGIELRFLNNIYLRGGMKSMFNDRFSEGATFGGGVRLDLFSGTSIYADYSYTTTEYLMDIQRFSLSIGM